MSRSPIIFTPEMEDLLRVLYPDTPNSEITRLTGWTVHILKYQCKRLGLKKTKACKAEQANATKWTNDMELFLRDNYLKLTNQQLAAALGLGLTVTRNKLREMGLCRMELDIPWNEVQIEFLVRHYKTMGDVEIAEQLQKLFPRKKLWTKKHVNKKRQLMNLHRSDKEIEAIVTEHLLPGGRCHTIIKNSASKNLPDAYLASLIAWRDKDLQQEILKYPDLIELKRQEIKLGWAIKEVENA